MIGNAGWSGDLYRGIPAGNVRNNYELESFFIPGGSKLGLYNNNGVVSGASYFLTRDIPSSTGSIDQFSKWSILDCPGNSCNVPPQQYCGNLLCPPLSYPIAQMDCISSSSG